MSAHVPGFWWCFLSLIFWRDHCRISGVGVRVWSTLPSGRGLLDSSWSIITSGSLFRSAHGLLQRVETGDSLA